MLFILSAGLKAGGRRENRMMMTMDNFLVAYAKITLEKNDVCLNGVYLGGIASDTQEADEMARSCVNEVKGGTVFPKVVRLPTNLSVIDTMYDIMDAFERMVEDMKETSKIIKRTQARK